MNCTGMQPKHQAVRLDARRIHVDEHMNIAVDGDEHAIIHQPASRRVAGKHTDATDDPDTAQRYEPSCQGK